MDASLSLEDGFESPSPTNIPNTNVIRNSHSASNMFQCTTLGETTTGTFYTDTTGAFSVTSLENMQAYDVGHEYDTAPYFEKPCPEFKDDTIIEGYEEVFNKLTAKGYAPQFRPKVDFI